MRVKAQVTRIVHQGDTGWALGGHQVVRLSVPFLRDEMHPGTVRRQAFTFHNGDWPDEDVDVFLEGEAVGAFTLGQEVWIDLTPVELEKEGE